MMTSIATVNDQALAYAKASLANGLALSRSSMPLLAEMMAVALVPEGVTPERAVDFKRGGLGRLDMTEVASLLRQAYPAASLVVELPLWRSDDPGVSDSDILILGCGNEVYAACHLRASVERIEKTLRLADPSFMYNAIALDHRTELTRDSCPADLVHAREARIEAVLIGAYDGEGFVFARSQPSS